jgi:hypothetical protein
MRKYLWGFRDQGRIDIHQLVTLFVTKVGAFFENTKRADILARLIAGREIIPDVWKAQRAEDGVCDGMAEDVGVRVTVESMSMGDFHAAENERAAFGKLVDVVSDA